VFVEFTDTGKGIHEEILERIFEPFFTTKKLGDGTGLGLSISRSILEEFGGNLSVSSKLGVGSTLTVRLPALIEPPASAEEKAPAIPADSHGATARILVIDDESNIARALMRLLGKSYSITAVSCGKDAQALIKVDPEFDVILCDLMMSRMSGIEFHTWLRTHDPRLANQLIFITGGAFTTRARDYLATVSNLTIEKPFDAIGLRSQVTAAVESARQRNRTGSYPEFRP
jgi:CheY-like chemotaxis protein